MRQPPAKLGSDRWLLADNSGRISIWRVFGIEHKVELIDWIERRSPEIGYISEEPRGVSFSSRDVTQILYFDYQKDAPAIVIYSYIAKQVHYSQSLCDTLLGPTNVRHPSHVGYTCCQSKG